MVKKIFPLILVLLFSFFSVGSLLQNGLPPTHDGEYHVIRFYEFLKVFSDGSLYPRWAPDLNNGFGLPLFDFVYPLPNYVSLFLHFLGISFINAFKLNLIFASLIGATFFYLFAKDHWGGLGGLVSGIFYSFSPYRLVDIYIRGSVGEVWAIALFPGLLWSTERMFKTQEKKYLIFSPILLSLIIFSHNILAFLFFIFYLSFIIFLLIKASNKRDFINKSILTLIIGLGLSAIFWLPAIIEKKYIIGLDIFDLTKHFPEIYQLIIPTWGSGFSGGIIANQMSFQIGMANLIAVFISLFILLVKRNFTKKRILIFFIAWFFVLFFLMLEASQWIWLNMPFLNYFQFPWRLLSLIIIICPFLAGAVIYSIRSQRTKLIVSLILIIFVLITTINYIKPAYYHQRDDQHYISRENFINGTNSPGNAFNTIWLRSIPPKEDRRIKNLNGDAEIEVLRSDAISHSILINAKTNASILLNVSYFPGWNVYIDGKKENLKNNKGRIETSVKEGRHVVKFKFENTFVQKFALFISLLSIVAIAILIWPIIFSTVIIKR